MKKRKASSLGGGASVASLYSSPIRRRPPQARRRRSAPSSAHEDVFAALREGEEKEEVGEEEEEEERVELGELASDTWVGLQILRSQFPLLSGDARTPPVPVLLKTQLYAIVTNHTDVDQQLDQLKKDGKLRLFKLLSLKDEYAIMLQEDYLSLIDITKQRHIDIQKQERANDKEPEECSAKAKDKEREKEEDSATETSAAIFDIFVRTVASTCCAKESITKAELSNLLFGDGPINETQITMLVNAGLLIRGREEIECFWFSIPSTGPFFSSCLKGRKEVITMLQRTRHKEMFREDLAKRKMRYSFLPPMFHVKDLIGKEVLESVETTAGPLIRLRN
ncbi:hypothetical protein QOT17_012103 [Balamuthia mandrillaris]